MKRRITRKTSKRIGRFTAIIALLLICSILICGCQETGITETSSVVVSQTSELPEIPHKKEMTIDIDDNGNEYGHILGVDGLENELIEHTNLRDDFAETIDRFVEAGIDKVTLQFTEEYKNDIYRSYCSTTTDKAAIDELFGILTQLEFQEDTLLMTERTGSIYFYFESQGVAYDASTELLNLFGMDDDSMIYATVTNEPNELKDLIKRMISFLERMGVEESADNLKIRLEELES